MRVAKGTLKGPLYPESEEEKYYFLSAIVKSSKKTRKRLALGPRIEKLLKIQLSQSVLSWLRYMAY